MMRVYLNIGDKYYYIKFFRLKVRENSLLIVI